MADSQSYRFIRDNISALENIREKCRLSTELHRTVTSLLEDWQTVESVTFKAEPKYANSPLKPQLKEPTIRSVPDITSLRPGNIAIPSSHGHAVQPQEDMGIWPRKKTDPLLSRSPQLPPRMHHQESSHPHNNRPLPPTPHTPDRRSPAANPNAVPSDSEEIKRYLASEKDTSNTPHYVNSISAPSPHPSSAERKPIAAPAEAHGTDWCHQNAENARLPTTAPPPIEVIQPEQTRLSSDQNPHTQHRPGELNMLVGEGNTIIQGSEPIEYYNHRHGSVLDKELVSRTKKSGTYPRERPQFPTPGPDENHLHTPGHSDQGDNIKIERSNSIDVLASGELRPQLPPRRKSVEASPPRHRMHYESKPGDPEYTNWLETHSHKPKQLGSGATFFDGTDINPAAENENGTEEVECRSEENGPLKSSDEYLVMFTAVEEAKPTQYRDEREDDKLAVFNVRELVSEKTELHTEQGLKRRRVIVERTFTHEEIGFYDLISNHCIFYFYLAEHNILIQELISLEQPLAKVLREKLSTFYNIDFGKSVITLGAKIGLLEVNDKINASLQKVENMFKKFYTKGKMVIDPKLSLHQSNITTSHLICVSQTDSIFDKTNFATYLQKREMDFMKQFQRLFVPLIQGTVPLRKDEIKDLISYLIVIYRIKDWEMLIPEIYKRDKEMKSDIESSIGMIYECSPEDIIPQVTKLVRNCKLRESIYFYVKINNKLDKKLNDAVLGVSTRNIHLISVSRSSEIELVYMWGIGDLKTWRLCEREIVMQFVDGTNILLSSPEQNEELIHVILKSVIDPKKYLFTS